jgi:hypothetical protein
MLRKEAGAEWEATSARKPALTPQHYSCSLAVLETNDAVIFLGGSQNGNFREMQMNRSKVDVNGSIGLGQ